MTVHEVTPAIDPNTLLPGAQFADAYRIEVDDRALNARQAAERMMARQPRWAEALLTLRNILVTPFGLKTSGASSTPREMVGIFPIVSESRTGWSPASTTSIWISASSWMSRRQAPPRRSPRPRWC